MVNTVLSRWNFVGKRSRIQSPLYYAVNKKEISVDKNELMSMLDIETRPAKTKNKKRKWREIEAIQDRYRLQKELEDMDLSLEAELENLWFKLEKALHMQSLF